MPQISAAESKWNESTVDFVGDLFLLEPLLGRNSNHGLHGPTCCFETYHLCPHMWKLTLEISSLEHGQWFWLGICGVYVNSPIM